jgi:hypothetical protein
VDVYRVDKSLFMPRVRSPSRSLVELRSPVAPLGLLRRISCLQACSDVSSERLLRGSFALSTSAPVHVWRFPVLVAAMQLSAWTPLPFPEAEVRDMFPYSFAKGWASSLMALLLTVLVAAAGGCFSRRLLGRR